jgi:hypothetical protein
VNRVFVEDRSARQVSETGKGENRIVLDWFSQVTHDWNGVEWNGVSESVKLHWTSDWMLREMLRTMLQYARHRSFTFSTCPMMRPASHLIHGNKAVLIHGSN